MRTLEDILADMQALMDKPQQTSDDLAAYLGLEVELAKAQQAAGVTATAPSAAETAAALPDDPVALAAVTRDARARHERYRTVVVPPGRPVSGEHPYQGLRPTGPRSAHYERARQNVDALHRAERIADAGANRV